MLCRRYGGNAFQMLDGFISAGRLYSFLDSFFVFVAEENAWEFWLHKETGLSWGDFKLTCIPQDVDVNGELENYQDILSAMIDGTVEDVEEALGKMQQGFIDAEHGNEKSLRRQADDMKKMVKQAEQAFADGQISEEYLNEIKQMETDSTIELNKCLAVIYGKDAEFAKAGKGNGNAWANDFSNALVANMGKITATIDSYILYLEKGIGAAGATSSVYVNSPHDAEIVRNKIPPKTATGGIVTRAQTRTVGENGAEAIIPLEHNTEWIDRVASRMSGNVSNSEVVSLLKEIKMLLTNQKIYLDGRTLVGGIAGEMDRKLGSMARLKGRG